MKKKYIYISIVAIMPLLTILSIVSFKTPQKDLLTSSLIVNIIPDFPAKVEWGGERVDLDRFDMRERYDRELTSFCYMHSNTLLILKRANRYFPLIEPILKKNGIPEDFIYLAAIESYLNPRAVSPAKAAGLWQLLPSTAKEAGLEVNDYVDERFNIEKSTEAACRYLKSAYAKYGSWTTVAASIMQEWGEFRKNWQSNNMILHLIFG